MVPAIVTLIGRQTVRDEQGVVSAQYAKSFSAHVAFRSTHSDLVFTGVYQNGTLVYVHVTRDVNLGKDATPDQIAKVVSQYEHPGPTDVFHEPWQPRYFGEYTYRVVNPTTIAFTSLVVDTAHGSGTFVIDPQNHVTSYQYLMSANWSHASSGNISGQRAQVLPGYWAMTSQTEQYKGRYGLFTGSATAQITQSSFQEFPNVDAAMNAAASTRRRR